MGWTLQDIAWDQFDSSKVNPDILAVIKAAAMVEFNAADYTAHLKALFHDDAAFCEYAAQWREEEVRHGEALGKWAEIADPSFNFAAAFKRFTDGYKIPAAEGQSLRGSKTGELIARCIVETGTSSFYSALRDSCDEPVLRDICHRIAGDEFRHYKFFLTAMRDYQKKENIPAWRRLLVALGRIRESEDDELAYAFHAANEQGQAYDCARASKAYAGRAFSFYRPVHAKRATNMVIKAAGLSPNGKIADFASWRLWRFIEKRSNKAA